MDLVADQYGWGDHAARRLQQRIKDAVDPGGILSPGKQGICRSRLPAAHGRADRASAEVAIDG